jgi:SAM-dependent methyltransferase
MTAFPASMTGTCAYERIPYPGLVIANTAPPHLALCSLWHRGPDPATGFFRLAELGCGDGSNLVPLAFYNPESHFTGIDVCARELCAARERARILGLTNLQFVHQDVRELLPLAPEFDYIVAHGLYSWVPQDVRDAILSFCGRALKPSGLAYISYNAQPGWATRRLVRETLLRSRSVREAAMEQKADRASEVAAQLLDDLPGGYASSILLADELNRVRSGKAPYVFHEYLAEVNDGFWLRDFVEDASGHGLEYVADAQFCRWEGAISAHLMSGLAKRDLDIIEQEELADLLCHRYFRASILCCAGSVRVSQSHREILEVVQIATSLTAQSDKLDLSEGRVEKFSGTGGIEITLDSSVTKSAVLLLSRLWPLGLTLNCLYRQASELVSSTGGEMGECARGQLSDDLATLFEAGQLDLRLRSPEYLAAALDKPQAHALARFEAEYGATLTTPYHMPLSFEPQTLLLIRGLDGSRSRCELRQTFGAGLVDGALEVLGRWGLLQGSAASAAE